MRTIGILAVILAFSLAACGKGDAASAQGSVAPAGGGQAAAPAVAKKYGVKSGIVEYETSAMGVTMKMIFYFDDFGAKECTEDFFDGKLAEIKFTDGKDQYTCRANDKDKVVWNIGASRGVMAKVVTEGMDRQRGVTILPNRSVCGKDCVAYTVESGKSTVTMVGFQGVLMHMESTGKMAVSQKAVKAEFDVPVPAEKFAPPAGYTVKKMS
jgi:hypothetical protein